jgi:hypothetical protein
MRVSNVAENNYLFGESGEGSQVRGVGLVRGVGFESFSGSKVRGVAFG